MDDLIGGIDFDPSLMTTPNYDGPEIKAIETGE